jgi:hypothetical protein
MCKRKRHPDTDRQKSKQTMILKPNIDNGLQGRTTFCTDRNLKLRLWSLKQ